MNPLVISFVFQSNQVTVALDFNSGATKERAVTD